MNFLKSAVSSILIVMLSVYLFSVPASAAEPPEVEADSSILVNVTQDMILFEENIHEKVYPASTTKVLTALLIIEAIERGEYALTDTLAAPRGLYYDIGEGASTQNIRSGEIMTISDYLHCTLIASANEACNALAIFDSGSVRAFVDKMNARIAELGCENTNFRNTHGMHSSRHYTTAYDMYLIYNEAIKHDIFNEIASKSTYTVPATNYRKERVLENTNSLFLKENENYYEFAVTGKTGSTSIAGSCLVSTAEKDDQTLICIMMGARLRNPRGGRDPQSFNETRKLYEWGFDNYSVHALLTEGNEYSSIPVKNGLNGDSVSLIADDSFSIYLENEVAENDITYEISLITDDENTIVAAPVNKDDVYGSITVKCGDEILHTANLIAKETITLSQKLYYQDLFENDKEFRSGVITVLVIAAIFVLLLVVLIIRAIIKARRRKAAEREEQAIKENYEKSIENSESDSSKEESEDADITEEEKSEETQEVQEKETADK